MDDRSYSQPSATDTAGKGKKRRLVLWIFLSCFVGLLAILVILYILGYTGVIFVRPDWARQLGIPTITPMCVRPTLMLGTARFPLDAIDRPADGSLPVPDGELGTAWWVTNTFAPFVLLLNLGTEEAAWQPGDAMTVQWADCGREEFVLTAVKPEAGAGALLEQASSGIAVVIRAQDIAYLLEGGRARMTLVTPEPPDPNATQTEVTFGETTISEDGKTLTTSLAILNTGSKVIVAKPEEVSLQVEGQAPVSPISIEPDLPVEIQAEERLTLTMTFLNPGGNIATLRLLDFAVDLYY